MENKSLKEFYTVKELADILHISRIAVFNRIKKGQIKAEKIGRNYIIRRKDLKGIICDSLTDNLKEEIDIGVARVIREYDDTLKMLGKE